MSLKIENLCIERGGRSVLSNISLTVEAGEMVVIAGPNGSGKSTLLGAISGELTPESGEIHFNGQPIGEWHLKSLARHRAVLLQSSSLTFPFRVIDVVLMGRSAHHDGLETARDIHIADAAIKMVGLDGLELRTYTQLSGGEKQRVHLARVLAQLWTETTQDSDAAAAPRFLILDEPTSSQDMAAQHLVLSSAQRCAQQGLGVLCVLHDLNQAAQYADRVLLLSEGTTVAIGTPIETLKPEILERIYSVPVQVLQHPSYNCPIVLSQPPNEARPDA